MQALAIVNRAKIECNLYKDGKHENIRAQLRKLSDIDQTIARLLGEGWRLFQVSGEDMYFVYEPQSASPFVIDPDVNASITRSGTAASRG